MAEVEVAEEAEAEAWRTGARRQGRAPGGGGCGGCGDGAPAASARRVCRAEPRRVTAVLMQLGLVTAADDADETPPPADTGEGGVGTIPAAGVEAAGGATTSDQVPEAGSRRQRQRASGHRKKVVCGAAEVRKILATRGGRSALLRRACDAARSCSPTCRRTWCSTSWSAARSRTTVARGTRERAGGQRRRGQRLQGARFSGEQASWPIESFRAASLGSSTSTTGGGCAPSRTTHARIPRRWTAWRCCATASVSSAARTTGLTTGSAASATMGSRSPLRPPTGASRKRRNSRLASRRSTGAHEEEVRPRGGKLAAVAARRDAAVNAGPRMNASGAAIRA